MSSDPADSTALILEAARALDMLDDAGGLGELDSFSALNLISEIEQLAGVKFPTESLVWSDFKHLDAIARRLDQLRGRGTRG